MERTMRRLTAFLFVGRGRFWASAALAAGVLTAGILSMASDHAMAGVQRLFAAITSGVLGLFGHATVTQGNAVLSDSFGLSVVTACTGLFVTVLFVVAVLLFPTTWRARSIGSLIGVAGLFVVNVIRLVTVYYVGVTWPNALETVHQLVWQSLVIVIAVGLWLAWAGRVPIVRARRAEG
jgi:exosortase/archaeosortase family protein